MFNKLYLISISIQFLFFFTSNQVFSQVKVGDNPNTINPSAVLEAESTNKGFLPPRMSTAQRMAINSPIQGLQIFNTDINCIEYFNGLNWYSVCGNLSCNNPPSAPVVNSASLIQQQQFTANWSSVQGATSYVLQVSTQSNFSNYVYNNSVGNNVSFNVNGLLASTTYYYRIQAINSCGSSSFSNSQSVSTSYLPGWYLYTVNLNETSHNNLNRRQIAFFGHNSNGSIRAVPHLNNTNSLQHFVKPFSFNPSDNTFTIGTKTNTMTYTSTAIFGQKVISEFDETPGTANTTNFGVVYAPNSNSPAPLTSVYLMSLDANLNTTVYSGTQFDITNVGTANMSTDICFDGTNANGPSYLMFSRYDVGTFNYYAFTRNGTNLTKYRTFSGFGTSNRALTIESYSGINDGSMLALDGQNGNINALTFGNPTRQTSTVTNLGFTTAYDGCRLTTGTNNKVLIAGYYGTGMAMRVISNTYSSNSAPIQTLGNIVVENSSLQFSHGKFRLLRGESDNSAFYFFLDGSTLKVKQVTINGTVPTIGSEIAIGSLVGATSFDITKAFIDSNNRYFVGVFRDVSGNVSAFALRFAL